VLSGRNGAGKTTLLRALAGELEPASGQIRREAEVALLPQTHDHLRTEQTVIDYFRSQVAMYADDAEELLAAYMFDLAEQRQTLRSPSAGELRRLLLAIIVNRGADVLLLDEPTNYLDFESLDVVEAALREYAGTIVMVTHDQRFAENVGHNRQLVLADLALTVVASDPVAHSSARR
jgi:ATPase subunit of ABC transporter with duplicated ATPase domains